MEIAMSHIIALTLVSTCLCQLTWAQITCQDQHGVQLTNHTFQFSMVGQKNQTGHWITQFLLNKDSPRITKNWKIDLKQSNTEYGGIHSFHLKGTIIVPPPKPEDYELFPGVGYYKFHYESKVTFPEASSICSREGGRLAIINSEQESNVLKTIYARHIKEVTPWSYIGFYDRNKARDFVTISGQPLSTTGFLKWHGNEPNNIGGNQFCGCVMNDGLLCDISCEDKISFFCEYDLSWSEL